MAISLDKATAEEDSQTGSDLSQTFLVVVEHVDGTTGEGYFGWVGAKGVVEFSGAGNTGTEVLVLRDTSRANTGVEGGGVDGRVWSRRHGGLDNRGRNNRGGTADER